MDTSYLRECFRNEVNNKITLSYCCFSTQASLSLAFLSTRILQKSSLSLEEKNNYVIWSKSQYMHAKRIQVVVGSLTGKCFERRVVVVDRTVKYVFLYLSCHCAFIMLLSRFVF